jgi:hypothetical protein
LRQVGDFLLVLRFLSTNKTDHHDIAEILLNVVSNTATLTLTVTPAGKPVTQESSLDVFCHVIFDVNIDVMDVRRRPQEFAAL